MTPYLPILSYLTIQDDTSFTSIPYLVTHSRVRSTLENVYILVYKTPPYIIYTSIGYLEVSTLWGGSVHAGGSDDPRRRTMERDSYQRPRWGVGPEFGARAWTRGSYVRHQACVLEKCCKCSEFDRVNSHAANEPQGANGVAKGLYLSTQGLDLPMSM